MSLAPTSETVHATCVVIDGRAVLLCGRSGVGKSDLALRLLDRGAGLISDDYTIVRRVKGRLIATAPPSIAGKLEVRGLGLVDWQAESEATVFLAIALDEPVERMPAEQPNFRSLAGVPIPEIPLQALEASAPIKVELALRNLANEPAD